MTTPPASPALFATLSDRALIRLSGPDWRGFLQGLITQDVETMTSGEMRYAALLTPQGRLLHDLFIIADDAGGLLDVSESTREALTSRLKMYRLRAKVEIAPEEGRVSAVFGDGAPAGSGWRPDPRLAALGWRGIDQASPDWAVPAADGAYDRHRLSLGVADVDRDSLSDRAYALEANLDLLNGVDFHKGCFVGQETTSRMKRRSVVKSRLAPLRFEGPAPSPGSEVLKGSLRAGEVRSGVEECALALLRLDRAMTGPLSVDGRLVALEIPEWMQGAAEEAAAAVAQD